MNKSKVWEAVEVKNHQYSGEYSQRDVEIADDVLIALAQKYLSGELVEKT